MHGYWKHSLASMFGSALLVATPVYRPLGAIYYFVVYRLAGFNPLPFRAICLALMLVNVWLAFSVIRLITGSLTAAFMAAFVFAAHPALLYLFYNSGTIYEILCFLFYFVALRCYISWRGSGLPLTWKKLSILLVLTACALDSKEMAMSLPLALALVEVVLFASRPWFREAIRRFVPALLTAALVVPVIAVKISTHNPLTDDPAYSTRTLASVVEGWRSFQSFLLYGRMYPPITLSTVEVVTLWAAMAVVAFLLRSRPMLFGLAFFIVAMTPVSYITRRSAYLLYIPLVGWCLYAGTLLQRLCDAAAALARLPRRMGTAARLTALAAGAAGIGYLHAKAIAGPEKGVRIEQSETRRIIEGLRKAHPSLPRGAKLLLLDDPAPSGYQPLLVAMIAYGDPTLVLDRVKMLPDPPDREALARYDYILAGGWNLHDVRDDSEMVPQANVYFVPATVRPNTAITVQIRRLAGSTVDLAVDSAAEGRVNRVLAPHWCTLDTNGRARLNIPDLPPQVIGVRWVRPAGGEWMPAVGTLEIVASRP